MACVERRRTVYRKREVFIVQNMQNAAERLNELKKGFGAFAKISPDVIGAFGQMRGA